MKMKKKLLSTSLATLMLMTTFGVSVNAMPTDVYSGRDRIQTSLKTPTVNGDKMLVIASAKAFPDALSAFNVTSKTNSKLVLVYPDTDLSSYLNQYQPKEIKLIGGEAVLNGQVVDQLTAYTKSKGYSIDRLAGRDRYATNKRTLEYLGTKNVGIADGRNFPDALSASGLLANKKMGLMLVNGARPYSADGYNIIYTFGGKNAVMQDGGKRLSGQNRYLTSQAINNELGTPERLAVTIGNDFPDALSAVNSVLKDSQKTATVLVDKNQNNFTYDQRDYVFKAKNADVVGGLVSQGIIDELRAMPKTVRGETIPEPLPGKVWVPEKGHYENVYKQVWVSNWQTVVVQPASTQTVRTGTRFVFSDGYVTSSISDAHAHSIANIKNGGSAGYTSQPIYETRTIPAVTKQVDRGSYQNKVVDRKWVVDVAGHYETR